MEHEEIIAMAREAGLTYDCYGKECCAVQEDADLEPELLRFAALVAEKAAARERERFALECIYLVAFHGGSVELEAAIRARGQKEGV